MICTYTDHYVNTLSTIKNEKKKKRLLVFEIPRFFITNTFTSNARLKLTKDQANAKKHPEAKLLLYMKVIHFFHPHYYPQIIVDILNNVQKPYASVQMRLYD